MLVGRPNSKPQQAKPGDRQSIAVLLERYRAGLIRYCCSFVCPPEADAEDAAQDAIVLAIRGFDQYRGDAALRTWLFSIGRRVCIDRLRKRTGGPTTTHPDGRDVDPGSKPEEIAVRRQMLAGLRAKLKEREWLILILSRAEKFSSKEIGLLLGISEGRVRQILKQMKPTIEDIWNDWNASDDDRDP